MAELTHDCCAPSVRAACCEPSEKAGCCREGGSSGCACAAGAAADVAAAGGPLPLPDASVDVVTSNCVINLSGDNAKVLSEAARVLKPGGRFAVCDVIADPDTDVRTTADMAAWTGCIAGALTEQEFRDALDGAGLIGAEFRHTHRVHARAGAAIIRAREPAR